MISFSFFCLLMTSSIKAQDSIHILMPTQYHDDEFDESLLKEKWYGLFKSAETCYIKKTSLHHSKEFDPIMDEDSLHPTGDYISVEESDQCILLFTGFGHIKEQNIKTILNSSISIKPGEQIEFDLAPYHYIFSAKGQQPDTETGWYESEYRFYLEETNVIKSKQLIAADTMSAESPYLIYWLGDLDGDNQLDIIINTSWHYNLNLITLFLSSRKQQGLLLKQVAQISSTGC